MTVSAEIDNTFVNFFGVVDAAIRDADDISKACVKLENVKSLTGLELQGLIGEQKWSDIDVQFHEKVLDVQSQVSKPFNCWFNIFTIFRLSSLCLFVFCF